MDGEGQLVLLSGDPGIGSPGSCASCAHRWKATFGCSNQCSPHHATSPLHPVIEQLERAAGFAPDDPPATRLDKLEALSGHGRNSLDEAVPLITALPGLPIEDVHWSDPTPLAKKRW